MKEGRKERDSGIQDGGKELEDIHMKASIPANHKHPQTELVCLCEPLLQPATRGPAGSHLPPSVDLVGQLDLVEADGRLHPVGAKVRRVRVDVDAAVAPPLAPPLRPAGRHPLAVDKLPAAAVGRHKVQQEGVHGAGVQA